MSVMPKCQQIFRPFYHIPLNLKHRQSKVYERSRNTHIDGSQKEEKEATDGCKADNLFRR